MNSNTERHYANEDEFHNALNNASNVQEALDIINAHDLRDTQEMYDENDSYYTLFYDDDSDENHDDDKYGFTDTCNF